MDTGCDKGLDTGCDKSLDTGCDKNLDTHHWYIKWSTYSHLDKKLGAYIIIMVLTWRIQMMKVLTWRMQIMKVITSKFKLFSFCYEVLQQEQALKHSHSPKCAFYCN